MKNPLSLLTSLALAKFRRDRSGSIAPIFALTVLPVMFLIGAAIDYSRAGPPAANLQSALDSAVLAGVKAVGSQVATAQEQFASATRGKAYRSASAQFTLNSDNTLSGTATATVATAVMTIARMNTLTLSASAKAKPPQTPSTVVFQLTAGYGWYWKQVDLYIHNPGDKADTLLASYIYQPTDMTGQNGRGTGVISARFRVNGVMTQNSVTTPISVGTAYDNIYLKMTVYSDGCGPGEAPDPSRPMAWYQTDFRCVASGSRINRSTVTKSTSPVYYSTNDAATAHNLFVGDPEVDLPANKVPNIFTLIPCGAPIQHAWEDTSDGPGSQSWKQQDIFFLVNATSCATNTNYPSGVGMSQLVQ